MSHRPLVCALAVTLALAGCGESKEDKAQNTVCDARADIQKQVDELKATTVTTGTLDGVQANLKAIGDGLQKMAKARADLTGDRRAELQKATQAFRAEVADVGRKLVTSVSLSDGKQQIQTAVQGLADSYKTAFAPIDC